MTSRRPSLTQRLAEQAERATFAAVVISVELARPHEHKDPAEHYACHVEGQCRLREALAASMERINQDGQILADEVKRRKGG